MIRPQRVPIRPILNQSAANDTSQSSTNAGDITSYIGKVLTINHHQVTVEQILGQGGFAFVFLVRSFNQQRYALKRLYVNNQRDLHVCQREIGLVKEFSSHPNIVKYVDSYIHRLSPTNIQRRPYYTGRNDNDDYDDDDSIYEILLLTEYCSYGTLVARLNEQRNVGIALNERQILRIFVDICNAISACHFRRPQPVLHRDIKLENILIDSRQNYVLCDFGSAIMLSSSTTNDFQQYQTNQLTTKVIQQLEEEIQRYTTLSYRAPEMIDLYSRVPITLKADIWAMGCLLYKLMYNTMPFGESILAIQNGTFVIPDDMAQDYSRDLNLLVRYILEIDINKRPDIWQVSYITYKLLGSECPIPNRCQSKIPDLKKVTMPLTDSESRQQRTTDLSKSKSTNVIDESLSVGTTVKPRERPRGMITPSASLINFSQTNQRSPAVVVPPPPSSSNPSRSGSAAQLMFDDDFSQLTSHAISLNNIPNVTTATTNEQNASRARPSPPATISAASGLTLQQQLFPPPPSSDVHSHRRSASQTINSTNIQSSFQHASSIDFTAQGQASDDDATQFSSDDEQLPNNQTTSKPSSHHPSTEGAEKNNHNLAKSLQPNSFIQQNESSVVSSTHLHEQPINQSTKENNLHDNTNHGFDTNAISTKSTNQANPSIIDNNNPFLQAPFHHSPANKQLLSTSSTNMDRTITTAKVPSFDANGIVIGKRSSAFAPYQKEEINTANCVTDTTNNPGASKDSFPSDVPHHQSSPSTNVFTSAPFKTKSKNKQHSAVTNQINNSHTQEQFDKKTLTPDNEYEQHGYSNLSYNETISDGDF